MIRIRNLVKRFGATTVLNGIDLDIAEGERIVIIGPSGTGKSTLLRCLNFLETPDEGQITIDDLTVDARHARKSQILALRRKTAFVFQNPLRPCTWCAWSARRSASATSPRR